MAHFRALHAAIFTLAIVPVCARAQQLPRLHAVEVYRLGGVNAPEEFAFAREPVLVVDSTGTVYARAASDVFITVLDARGRFVRRIGGGGEGPGEFQVAASHGLIGDTLWVRNWPAPRISRFLPDGTHVDTRRTPFDYGVPMSSPGGITGLLQGNRVYVLPDGVAVGAAEALRLPVLSGPWHQPAADTIGLLRSARGMRIAGLGVFAYEPFASSPLLAFAADGSGFAIAEWQEAQPGRLAIRRLAHNGRIIFDRALELAVDRVSRGVREEVLRAGVEAASPVIERARQGGEIRGSAEELVRDALRIPEYYPPARSVLPGIDGTTWIERHVPGDLPEWLVLDQGGEPVARLTLPRGIRLQQATLSRVWATQLDSLDVPYIVHMRLEPT